jgi:hypothetical protein
MIYILIILLIIAISFFGYTAAVKKPSSQNDLAKALPTKILLQLAPESTAVKTLYDVFSWGQEAKGEYLFYGEIDRPAVKQDGTGDLSLASFAAQVSVSFESDLRAVVQEDIQHYISTNNQSKHSFENFLNEFDRGNFTPAQTCLFLNSVHEIVIDVSKNSYRRLMADNNSPFVVLYAALIERDRITEITLRSSNQQTNLKWLWEKFDSLCREYAEIPYVRFEGAEDD